MDSVEELSSESYVESARGDGVLRIIAPVLGYLALAGAAAYVLSSGARAEGSYREIRSEVIRPYEAGGNLPARGNEGGLERIFIGAEPLTNEKNE